MLIVFVVLIKITAWKKILKTHLMRYSLFLSYEINIEKVEMFFFSTDMIKSD